MIGLSISVVSYFHAEVTLDATLDSLEVALSNVAISEELIADVILVDNSEHGSDEPRLRQWLANRPEPALGIARARLKVTRSNCGYGAANNAAQASVDPALDSVPPKQRWVLILNPDVVLQADALTIGLRYLCTNPTVSMLSPRALDDAGQDLYLAHRYPSVSVLALRASPQIKPQKWMTKRMENYELRDFVADQSHQESICASGCFMLMPLRSWQQSGGFDERFFLYFEDYDLSCRLLHIGPIAYEPAVRIRHEGGQAAGKNWRHRILFVQSALRFFWLNGWPKRQPRHVHVSGSTQ